MEKKVLAIKKQLLKYIYENNVDVYIKIQTLYEFAIKQYVEMLYKYESINLKNFSTIQLLNEYIPHSCSEKNKIIDVFSSINSMANNGIKHFDYQVAFYDKLLVEKGIKYFNILVSTLYNNKEQYKMLYHIDESIFFSDNIVKLSHDVNIKDNYTFVSSIEKNKTVRNIINVKTSEQDSIFEIFGIKEMICSYQYKSIYAIIFNFMQRSSIIYKDIIVEEFERNKGLRVNYSKVYRYEMTLLLLIKNDYGSTGKIFVYSKEAYNLELECAIYHINKLFDCISSLMKQEIAKIDICIDKTGLYISFENLGEINIADCLFENDDKMIWYSQNIRYDVDIEKDKETLEYLLDILLKIKKFRDGQYEAVCEILNNDLSKIIIMPTGSGKSLVFYFVSLLQPSPTIIVEPTEILIKDQLRNLNKYHNINDCIGYFGNFNDRININHNFIYLTPKVLQNKKSILSLIPYNVDIKISNIILDEIHTISNWSHDFRPDYLMMSFNLKTFLDNSKYLGFTATANYRVIRDISLQLNISFDDIHTPIALNNKKIEFIFNSVSDDTIAMKQVNEVGESLENSTNEKMLVFTKNIEISRMIKNNLSEDLKFDVDVFSDDDENSYLGFISGRRSILISQSDMGIGINIPAINKIYHYGIPISKSKYVQEIGRAGRLLNTSYSYVVYKGKENLSNDELKLLDLNTSIDDILNIISCSKCDLAFAFKQMLGHLSHYCVMASRIKEIYNDICIKKEYSHIQMTFKLIEPNSRRNVETCLFFLFKMGLIYNWYVDSFGLNSVTYDVEISEDITLPTIKKKCIEHILLFGNAKENIYNIEESDTIENIIYELQTWYFEQFLMYHREQLVNMYEFVDYCRKQNISSSEISEELFKYFSLTSTDIDEDVLEYIDRVKSVQDIKYNEIYKEDKEFISDALDKLKSETKNKYVLLLNDIKNNNDINILMQMEKFLETRYEVLADLYIFTFNCVWFNNVHMSRFKRIFSSINSNDYEEFMEFIALIYNIISNYESKLLMINILNEYIDIEVIINVIFNFNNKDKIYYGFLSKRVCERMKELYE